MTQISELTQQPTTEADSAPFFIRGKVVEGKEVVDKIKGVVVDDVKGMQNVPVVPIVIKSATVVKAVK